MKSLLLSLATVTQVSAFWRMRCSNIQVGRIDPIISPGGISSHVHTIAGPINFNTTSTYSSLQASFCTSCQIQDDKSAYWTPQLYYRHTDGTYVTVRNDGTVVYYLGRGDDRNNTITFPPGFRMVSGDTTARSYNNATMTYGTANNPSRPIADRVSFNCLTANYSPLPETYGMVRTDCANGLRAQIQFQSCWDGVNLYKSDQSHVAYLSQIDNGICPPTHPKLLPHLFFEIYYFPNEIDTSDGGQFMFANGDTTGYGFHGDFLNGWNINVLQSGIDQCLNALQSGVVEDCAPLAASNDEYFSQNCPLQPPLVNEQINGVSSLPGCNQPSSGPAKAPVPSCPAVPNLNPVANTDGWVRMQPTNTTIVAGALYQGCYAETNGRALNSASYADNGMTTESCAAYCFGKGYTLFGTEYARECYCGSTISTNRTANTDCGMACSGNLTEYCGGPNRLSVWKSISVSVSSSSSSTATTTTTTTGSTASPTLTLADGSIYLGCYSDSTSSRSLNGPSTTSNTMTAEICAKFAKDNNLQYFGVEYASECYVGNSIGSTTILQSKCYMPCSGASNQTCGGPNALSVYKNNGYVKVSNPSPVSVSNVQYVYSGCYAEGTSGRAIADWAFTNSSMTVELCVAACYKNGYSYAALEYMHECYCNNAGITNGGVVASESDCNMLCDGNKTEYCGGASRLSLYHSS